MTLPKLIIYQNIPAHQMIALGIEGTAHTISCGIVDDNRILGNASSTYENPNGGIHPREAAIHHADNVSKVIRLALEKSKVRMDEIDLVAFSRGPGLGPCLRIAATAARTIAIRYGKPLVGVNHPLGHVEIGRKITGARDPMMLYVSGGNTQIIAHVNGRYRVLGETMDIGLGNMLDKLARDMGYPFPGGPAIEGLAREGKRLLDLPYSVKGMDTSFSGMYTSAKRYLQDGKSPEDISFSVQETAFSMLVEVLERGFYQTEKDEILLAGGVARNERLRGMISSLSEEIGATPYLTASEYCMDNGAMIAQAGLLMYRSGFKTNIETSTIDQRFRIDEVEVPWIAGSVKGFRRDMGAESRIERGIYHGRQAIFKQRIPKAYRDQGFDEKIRFQRLKNEASLILHMKDAGIGVPLIYDIIPEEYLIIYEFIKGNLFREHLFSNIKTEEVIDSIGLMAGKMHAAGITHGDLAAGNIIISSENKIYFIDPSLGKIDSRPDDKAADLYLFKESLRVYRTDADDLFGIFLKGYSDTAGNINEVLESLGDIEKRRRYV